MALRQNYTGKLLSAEEMQEKRKQENNLQAKTLSKIFKKFYVLSWARSLIVQSITRHHMSNGK